MPSKRKRVPRKRDYKAEYQRRLQRAKEKGYSVAVARGHAPKGTLGIRAAKRAKELLAIRQQVEKEVERDARKVFGRKPKREKGEQPFIYQEKLEELKKRDGQFAWTDEQSFVDEMLELGLTERDAYTFWFSP